MRFRGINIQILKEEDLLAAQGKVPNLVSEKKYPDGTMVMVPDMPPPVQPEPEPEPEVQPEVQPEPEPEVQPESQSKSEQTKNKKKPAGK